MGARIRALLLLCAAACASSAQTNDSVWDEPIRFSTKAKDSCSMLVSSAGDYTRLRVSCKGPSPTPVQAQGQARSYSCDFQGRPDLCRAYSTQPRHYFIQIMWDMRKLSHACQGQKIYRPHMCKKYPDEAQMTFLTSRPKAASRAPKPVPEQRKPAKPQPAKPASGKGGHVRRTTQRPAKVAERPTEAPESVASRLATEYCWKSLHGVCSYIINWFQN